MIFIPFLFSYFLVQQNILSVIFGLIVSLLIPVGPILLGSLIIILLMNFVPFFKNKNTINLVIGIITLVLSLGINLFIQNLNVGYEEIIELLQSGNNSLSQALFAVFPNVRFASNAIINTSITSLALFILFSVIMVLIYILFAQKFYLNGATTINEVSKSKNKFKTEQLNNQKSTSIVSAFSVREIKTLFRIPAILLNGVLPIFIFPILIMIMPLMNSTADIDAFELKSFISTFLSDIPTAILIGLGAGLLIASMNMLPVTAISREAKVLGHLKAYPIDHFKMILGKLIVYLTLSSLGSLFMLVAINFAISLPWQFNLISFLSASISSLFAILIAISIDIHRPNLKWTNDIQVMKQSFNTFFNIFGLWILTGLFAFIVFQFANNILMITVIMLAFFVLCIVGLIYYLFVNTTDLILKIDA